MSSKYNPFRSTPSTLTPSQLGGQANASGPASPAPAITPPPDVIANDSISRSPISDFPEDPPPYTPQPSAFSGETTVEQGPARPFQPAPSRNTRIPNNNGPVPGPFPTRMPSPSRAGGGLLQQITGTINQVIDEISSAFDHPPTSSSASARAGGGYQWSSYPGQQQQQSQSYRPPPGPPPASQSLSQTYRPPPNNTSLHPGLAPPPRHPSQRGRTPSPRLSSPALPSPSPSSDFARDFYAAGAGEGLNLVEDDAHSASGPSNRRRASMGDIGAASSSSKGDRRNVPDDGRPTTYPVAGHPLLKDGKLLVYPVGYECDKCHNIGYKNADPDKPCKKCWNKHAKHFSGPLAYSFSSSTSASSSTASNFQRPLPSVPAPQTQGGRRMHHSHSHSHNHHGHNRNISYPPTPQPGPPPMPGAFPGRPGDGGPDNFSRGLHNRLDRLGLNPGLSRDFGSTGFGPGGSGSVVYQPGDPRIGGQLCWRCDGRGSTSFLLLDRIMCSACGGAGRTF